MPETIDWNIGGQHWLDYSNKEWDAFDRFRRRGLRLSVKRTENGYVSTQIYNKICGSLVDVITTPVYKHTINAAYYRHLCQILNFLEPEQCHYYDAEKGWTTRPRVRKCEGEHAEPCDQITA